MNKVAVGQVFPEYFGSTNYSISINHPIIDIDSVAK
jgi:hypothetical protein